MEYISVNEAAVKWGVHIRIVQGYCKDGRIFGAQKFGRSWMIPADTDKPDDPRRFSKAMLAEKTTEISFKTPLPGFTMLYRSPGSGDAVRASLAATPDMQALFASHLAYFRGEIETAHEAAKPLLASASCFEARVGAGLALSLCAMYQGDLALWQEAKRYIAGTRCYSQRERERLAFWLAATDSAILDNMGFPKDFCRGCFDLLPQDSFPAARFFYAKYLYMEFNNSVIELNQSGESPLHTSLSYMLPPICELMISQTRAEGVLIAEVYLRLICAVAYHNIGNNALASVHIDRALALALPDKLYSPLAEYRQPLDFLMDERLNAIDPAALKAVRALSKRLMEGWVKLHNTILDRHVSKDLTAREREVSRFAVYGLSNAEIAQRLCISIATVKQALWSAMDKTGAGNRSELVDFI